MKRLPCTPRPGWQETVESQGLLFHTTDERSYWNEQAYYEFTEAEVERLEHATSELNELCLEAVQHVIDGGDAAFERLKIPKDAIPLITRSWDNDAPSVYGRFDLAYDGKGGPPKLLEFNADTPTSLMEAAVIQHYWLQDTFPDNDQYNSIHERLVAAWTRRKPQLLPQIPEAALRKRVHFAHIEDAEDMLTVSYMRDAAEQAGIDTEALLIEEIGVTQHSNLHRFRDVDGSPILNCFKLYPWEWMVHEDNWKHVVAAEHDTCWIEPIWKMILSNKGILAVLWELNPNHPNLLETHLEGSFDMWEYVKKPLLSREGANVQITTTEQFIETGGEYGEEGFVYQKYVQLPNFDGNHAVIGSWLIDHEPAGIGIRESNHLITDNASRFVPHIIV